MTRLLVDTNVALDVLLERQPHFGASAAVWSAEHVRLFSNAAEPIGRQIGQLGAADLARLNVALALAMGLAD